MEIEAAQGPVREHQLRASETAQSGHLEPAVIGGFQIAVRQTLVPTNEARVNQLHRAIAVMLLVHARPLTDNACTEKTANQVARAFVGTMLEGQVVDGRAVLSLVQGAHDVFLGTTRLHVPPLCP